MLKVFNTLTRKKEIFKPIKDKKVQLFVCGITPYSNAHIGHAKTYIQFDIIVKYLKYLKYNVFYLQNVTDIDDKIIRRANEENKTWKEIARKYEKEYHEDMKELNVDSVDNFARATDYIKEIQSQVKRLIEKDYAYKISDGYYFDLSKFPEYGKLSKRTEQQAQDAVSRIDENKEKRNKGDFCLWKFSKENEPSWDWEPGEKGRPGWHIEDTAITEKEFGPQYDVHGGAVDLIFPHHECEIAQMEAVSGKKPLVKYWLHTEFLNINKEKMSKSLKNFITIKDVLEIYDGKVLRYFFASNHYRTPINFTYDILEQSKNALERVNDFIRNLKNSKGKDDLTLIKKTRENFIKAMDDDFDTPKAWAVIFDFMKLVNKKGGGKKSYELMLEFDKIFNVLDLKDKKLDKEIEKMIKEREYARKNKDFNKADEIRNKLGEKGVILEDTKEGVKWKLR
ncbi:cysteine--tRNA ligase [Candidatus Woesearchaeota archaeon]|nr:cysteine--tRNA ligase [Candidatus Woesearchaeota archaeon]